LDSLLFIVTVFLVAIFLVTLSLLNDVFADLYYCSVILLSDNIKTFDQEACHEEAVN